MKNLVKLIAVGMVAFMLGFGFVKMCQSVMLEKAEYGGSYDVCLESHAPSTCKQMFLD